MIKLYIKPLKDNYLNNDNHMTTSKTNYVAYKL